MKERSQIILLIVILLAIGAGFAYFTIKGTDFTFYKAEINVLSSDTIEEKLYFTPNKAYHTLYRNFKTPILPIYSPGLNQIQIISVACSHGISYYEDNVGTQHIMSDNPETGLTYTENNEYGCGFGNILGFSEGEEYFISARYRLGPNSLIEYNGKHYIKFVAYEMYKHPFLNHNTLKINGDALYAKYVPALSDFTIYIPYEPTDIGRYNVIHEQRLRTSNNTLLFILYILAIFGPTLICLIVWYLFGKEYKEEDLPEELSQYPKERKAWEVAIYFHPPFGDIDRNFLPAMMLDFYHRKIIDIKIKKEGAIIKQQEVYIKILQHDGSKLDDMDLEVLNFLKGMEYMGQSEDGYFCIKDVSAGLIIKDGKKKRDLFAPTTAKSYYDTLKIKVKEHSKEHISYKGWTVLIVTYIAVAVILMLTTAWISGASELGDAMKFYFIIAGAAIGIFYKKTSLFIRFKEDYYTEFQQWQGFKRYLSHLDSIPRTPYKGVVMWEKYLIYATAMGVGKKVLDEMKKLNVINKDVHRTYSCIYANTAFGSFSSPSGGGGGMGGGGIGGGGGGGR